MNSAIEKVIIHKLNVLENESKQLLQAVARLEERTIGRAAFTELEHRVDRLEQADAKRKGVVAGLSVAGGGAVAGLVEMLRRFFE